MKHQWTGQSTAGGTGERITHSKQAIQRLLSQGLLNRDEIVTEGSGSMEQWWEGQLVSVKHQWMGQSTAGGTGERITHSKHAIMRLLFQSLLIQDEIVYRGSVSAISDGRGSYNVVI